ncbi:hypothetical protein RI129_012978 [Pyrocoelia pectoralis]|uniref:Putative sodium-coupled neutral amino acid transporter 11 n=1 Tax=Pyrocoelia pectoralis TaxID=417401 RepID=A0AAN7V0M6_9COLE
MANIKGKVNEKSYILQSSYTFSEDQGSSIDSNENAFDDMKQLIEGEENESRSSLSRASFNFINSIIGSGVIGIPYALHQSGFGLGLMLLVMIAYVTDYSLILMVKSGHISGKYSYQGIMEAAYGRVGYILLGVLQVVYPLIAMVSYNVVVGDTVTKVVVRLTNASPTSIFSKREVIVLVCTIAVTIPLCMYRNITKLAHISFTSLICIGTILITIFFRVGPMSQIVPHHSSAWKFANWDIVPAMGIMSFAFMCHHNTFLIYSSIQEANEKRWEIVTHISLTISLIITALFGIVGYATFTTFVQGDLLENYCSDDDLMNFSRLLFSITILLTFPIECFVVRDVLESSFFRHDPNVPISDRMHYITTLLIISISYFTSIATDCFGVVLELNGILAATPLAYVLPALCYLKLEEGYIFSRKKLPAVGLALFGLLVTILGVFFICADFNEVDTCSHGKIMSYCMENFTLITNVSSSNRI